MADMQLTGRGKGHWVMLEHQENIKKITIWDPLRHKVEGIKEIEATCQWQGFGVEYRGLGKQTDGWSCGYHMLECTQELMTNPDRWTKDQPETKYSQKRVVQKWNQVLEQATREEEDLKETTPQKQKTKETTTSETLEEQGQAAAPEDTSQKTPKESTQEQKSFDWNTSATEMLRQAASKKKTRIPTSTKPKKAAQEQGPLDWSTSATELMRQITSKMKEQIKEAPKKKEPKKEAPKAQKQKVYKTALAQYKPGKLKEEDMLHIVSNNMQGSLSPIERENKTKRRQSKIKEVWFSMKEKKIDVLMLQETRMDEEETRSEKWRHIQEQAIRHSHHQMKVNPLKQE